MSPVMFPINLAADRFFETMELRFAFSTGHTQSIIHIPVSYIPRSKHQLFLNYWIDNAYLVYLSRHVYQRITMRCFHINITFANDRKVNDYQLIFMEIIQLSNAPVTLYRDPTAWARQFKISQSAVGSHGNTRNVANNFTFSITWRCHGAPTATMALLRSAYGVPPRSHGVLTGDWLRGHGALMACSWRFLRCLHALYTSILPKSLCI